MSPRGATKGKPSDVSICPVCRAVMPLGKRAAHLSADHPGYRLARHGWMLDVIDPEGAITSYSSQELGAMRREAQAAAAAAGRGPEPSPGPAPAPEAPPTIDETRRPFAWQATAAPPIVTRQAIADALTERMLADMIRQVSMTLSEWDGAGEAGHLSAIESAQLAALFYDSTLGLIERYFRGSVDRFRLAVGLAILLLGKGRIHLAAIARRRRAASIEAETAAYVDELAAAAAPDYDPLATWAPAPVSPEPEPAPAPRTLSQAELVAERQRAWRQSQAATA